MQSASSLVTDRIVYYKHADANFYSAWPFVFGRIVSQIPQVSEVYLDALVISLDVVFSPY